MRTEGTRLKGEELKQATASSKMNRMKSSLSASGKPLKGRFSASAMLNNESAIN
jgi:hypothetical protein